MSDLELIRYEAQMLYKQTNGDIDGVTHFVNKVFAKSYTPQDMRRILDGKEPYKRQRAPVVPRLELKADSKLANLDPIGWQPPISTPAKDPLVIALKAYQAKYADKIQEALQRGW